MDKSYCNYTYVGKYGLCFEIKLGTSVQCWRYVKRLAGLHWALYTKFVHQV